MANRARSVTALAFDKRREAYSERQSKPVPIFADRLDQDAADLLTLPIKPDLGPGGEVVRFTSAPHSLPLAMRPMNGKRTAIRNTLAEGATRVAEDASIRRTDLLMQSNFNVLELAVDAAESVGAANSID